MQFQILQELVNKLNNWLHSLNQEKIIIDYTNTEDNAKYLFNIVPDEHNPEKITLRKLTRFGNRLKYVFSNLRGIKAIQKPHLGQSIIILSELEPQSFTTLNDCFDNIVESLQQKAIEGTPRPFRQIKSLSLPNYGATIQSDKKIQEVLNSQDDKIDLDSVDFDRVSEEKLEQLKNKLMTQRHNFLSLNSCYLGRLPDNVFLLIMDIIQISQVKKIHLKSNDLHLLQKDLLSSLFQTLTKAEIKEINLSKNKIGSLLAKHSELFIDYLKKNSLVRMELRHNEINDHITKTLATHGRIETLHLGDNRISNEGVTGFITNTFIHRINLFNTYVNDSAKKQLDMQCTINRKKSENEFVEQVIAIAQGYKNKGNPFNQLPKDLVICIILILGEGLRERLSIQFLSMLVIKNILESKPNKLVWQKELEINTHEKRVIFTTQKRPSLLFFNYDAEKKREPLIDSHSQISLGTWS